MLRFIVLAHLSNPREPKTGIILHTSEWSELNLEPFMCINYTRTSMMTHSVCGGLALTLILRDCEKYVFTITLLWCRFNGFWKTILTTKSKGKWFVLFRAFHPKLCHSGFTFTEHSLKVFLLRESVGIKVSLKLLTVWPLRGRRLAGSTCEGNNSLLIKAVGHWHF